MKRILVSGMSNNRAGTEAVIANIVSSLEGEVAFDILTDEHLSNFEKVLVGDNRELIVPNKRRKPLAYYKEINKIFEEQASEYSAVWSNLNMLNNVDVLRLGAKYGIPRRILHSHNSHKDGKPHQRALCLLHRNDVEKYVTDRWACSKLAGEFMFGDKDYVMVPNAIDFGRFAYDEDARQRVRSELGIAEGTFVIGTIGRLAGQKNQRFLIDLMPQLLKKNPEALLVIIGDGELRESLQKQARSLCVQDRVLFAGQRQDSWACYSAFDVFVLPSLFEGMPVALIEAQANGLPCVVSDLVSPDAAISHTTFLLPLTEELWISAISQGRRVSDSLDKEEAAKFDLDNQSEFLKELFQ